MKTFHLKPGQHQRRWYVIDLANQPLGRAASVIAKVLWGKHLPTFTPHIDGGDFVICINAEKVYLSGAKEQDKIYRDFTGWAGGLKETTAGRLRNEHPDRIITRAVKGMLPKSALGKRMLKKLKVYAGTEHPHAAQQPENMDLAPHLHSPKRAA